MAQLPSLAHAAHHCLRSLHLRPGQLHGSAGHILADVLPPQPHLPQLCLELPSAAAVPSLMPSLQPHLPQLCLDLPSAAAVPSLMPSLLPSLQLHTACMLMHRPGAGVVPALEPVPGCDRRPRRSHLAGHAALISLHLGVADALNPPIWPEAFPRLHAMTLVLSPR
eukprot:jgi/Ulvmu1/12228/UM086_0018.1